MATSGHASGCDRFSDEDIELAGEIAEHLQSEVDRIFLDQEVFGLSGRLYSAARRTMIFLVSAVFLAFVFGLLALMGWGVLPSLVGD